MLKNPDLEQKIETLEKRIKELEKQFQLKELEKQFQLKYVAELFFQGDQTPGYGPDVISKIKERFGLP